MPAGVTRRGFFAAVVAGLAAIPLGRRLRPPPRRQLWIGHYWPMPPRAKERPPG
jgi:hypothetical protein